MDEHGWRIGAWAVAGIAAAVLGVRALMGCAAPAPVPVTTDPTHAGARPARRAERPALYVHVAGAVRRPGLYRVAPGARVAVAVARAGGPLRRADLAGVNLAAVVEDGQQVVVPARGVGGAASADAATGPISLGSATAEQLDAVDGIGPTLAERIVEHRRTNGGFSSVEQLDEVDGIGEKRLEVLREALTP